MVVLVNSTAGTSTAVITQTAPYTAMEGGVVSLRNQAEQDAWAPANGSMAYRVDLARFMVRDSGSWVPSVRTATYTFAAGGAPDSAVISGTAAISALTAETNDSSFVTATSGLAFTVKAGIYIVTLHLRSDTAFTGRSFVEIAKGSSTIARNNSQVSDDNVTATATVMVESDGIVLTGRLFKTTGGTANLSGRVTLTKLS